MSDFLPGLKTKIMGYVLALGAIIDHVSSNYNPESVDSWLPGVNEWVVAAYVGAGVAINWFRNLAGK